MALMPADRRATIVLFIALLFTIVGTSLIYHATYDDSFDAGTHGTKSAFRYEATYFYFLWASAFVTTSFQRPILMAITAGLLCSIIVFNFSFNEMDLIRIKLNFLKDLKDAVPSGAPENPFETPFKLLQQVAGGVILSYIGAGLAFIASVLVFRRQSRLGGMRTLLAAGIVLFGFLGCVLLWSSRDVQTTQALVPKPSVARSGGGSVLFDMADCTAAVLVVYVLGFAFGISPLIYVSAFLAAFYNLSSLGTYLIFDDNKFQSKEQTAAGCVFCWLSAVFMVLFCAFEELPPDSEYGDLSRDSHA